MGSSPTGPIMKKIEKIRNREAARVLIIQAMDMIELARDKMLEIENDPTIKALWNKAQNAIWDLHTQNYDKQLVEK